MSNGLLPKNDTFMCQKSEKQEDPHRFLREYFHYDPYSGELVKLKCYHKVKIGANAVKDAPGKDGNAVVFLVHNNKVLCLSAWKVAYYLFKGVFLGKDFNCMFRDGNKFNLKLDNMVVMRASDFFHYQNNLIGKFGIQITEDGERFKVTIKVNGEPKYLGMFDTEKSARIAYMQEKVRIRKQAVNVLIA